MTKGVADVRERARLAQAESSAVICWAVSISEICADLKKLAFFLRWVSLKATASIVQGEDFKRRTVFSVAAYGLPYIVCVDIQS